MFSVNQALSLLKSDESDSDICANTRDESRSSSESSHASTPSQLDLYLEDSDDCVSEPTIETAD